MKENELLIETNRLLEKLIKQKSLKYNFLVGLAQSLGATLGLAIVLGIITYILRQLPLTKLVGNWLATVIDEAIKQIGF